MNLTAKDIARALGIAKRHAQRRAVKESWPFETRKLNGGLQRIYDLKDLSEDVKVKIISSIQNPPLLPNLIPAVPSVEVPYSAAGCATQSAASSGKNTPSPPAYNLRGQAQSSPARGEADMEGNISPLTPPSPARGEGEKAGGRELSPDRVKTSAGDIVDLSTGEVLAEKDAPGPHPTLSPMMPISSYPSPIKGEGRVGAGRGIKGKDFALATEPAQKKARTWERIIRAAAPALDSPDRAAALGHYMAAYNAGHMDGELLREGGKISIRTFYRKLAAFERGGLAALLPGYKGRGRDLHADVEKKALFYFLERSRKARRIYEYLRQDFPKKIVPSYSTLVRFLNSWAEEHPQEVCLAHWGESRWKKKFLAAFGSASEEAPYPNHTWEIDSTVADIMTKDGKRWKLIGCLDVHSRLCPALMLQDKSNAWGIVQTLGQAFGKYGIPERLKKDNGKDYASRWVNRFLSDLGVQTPRLPVRAPEKKPHIERFFGTLSGSFLAELTGYTGNSLLTRPEEIKVNYTSDEFDSLLQRWVEGVYNEQSPSTTGVVRRERFFLPGLQLMKVTAEELEVLMHPAYGGKRVGKKGIVFDGRQYATPELVGLIGQRVEFRLDVNDVSHIMVFRKKEFYCHARDAAAADWTLEKYREEKREHQRALKQLVKSEKSLAKGDVRDRMLKALDEKAAKSPLRFPAPEELINIIDLSKCSVREPEKERTPYDDFPERVAELPHYDAYLNYEYLLESEALGIPIEPELLKWKDDYMNGRIPGFEREWYAMYGRHKDDPTTVNPLWWKIEQLKKYAANRR